MNHVLSLSQLLQLAQSTAAAPAALILQGFRNPDLRVDLKADGSVVTRFDREAERMVRDILARAGQWPLLGEESGTDGRDDSGERHRWVLDPIDGTLGYTRGLPTFGTLLAFEEYPAPRTLAGAIHLPVPAETYAAARGLGAWCNGRPIRVAPDRPWSQRLIAHVPRANFERAGLLDGYERLMRAGTQQRGCHDCWSHAMTARGAIDALVELGLNRWDIAATEVIVAEAGGTTCIRPSRYGRNKYDVVLGNSRAVDELVRLLEFDSGVELRRDPLTHAGGGGAAPS